MRGLRELNFYVGCVGYIGQNIFYAGHNFNLGCVGQNFLRELNFFCVGQLFCCGSQKMSIGAFTIIP